MSVHESGNTFVSLRASRLGIGHDQDGNLIIVQFDGDGNHHKGPNLYELAQVMIDLGAVNAINLDGGGSTTVVQDDLLVNTISDGCPPVEGQTELSAIQRCARKVTSITCIHDAWTDIVPTTTANPTTIATTTSTIATTTTSSPIEKELLTNCTREYNKVSNI
jgi:hypothetical protein